MPLALRSVNGGKQVTKLSTEKAKSVDSFYVCHHDAAAISAQY
jgi:hypothetical protein